VSAGKRNSERALPAPIARSGVSTNGRRPGSGVRRRPNPAKVRAGPGRAGRPGAIHVALGRRLGGARSAPPSARPATEDVRGLVRPVRLPQPMGAGGQQPPRSHRRCRRHAAPAEMGRSYHGEIPCCPAANALWREPQGPRLGTDSVRTMLQRRHVRAVEVRVGRKAEQGASNLDAPANK